mmetsp:Transcript_22379/g.41102  ORF Transcript_22379/g.41102 Transcript_22379/m.41102 type:complete len:85 (+) Transcript_22379:925-1179(+)
MSLQSARTMRAGSSACWTRKSTFCTNTIKSWQSSPHGIHGDCELQLWAYSEGAMEMWGLEPAPDVASMCVCLLTYFCRQLVYAC